ncbi:MAG: hypothetical protein ACI8UO_005516 [Verrucomicrobiales bacterium]|jgi:hypothetical protein
MLQLTELQKKLEADPDDWDLRLEVIEGLVSREQLDDARNLVRDSPDGPVPYHVQKRLWDALSGTSSVKVIDDGSSSPDAKPNLIAKAKVVVPGKKAEPKTKNEVVIPPPPMLSEKKEDEPFEPKPYVSSSSDQNVAPPPKLTRIAAAAPTALLRQVPAAAGDSKDELAAGKFQLAPIDEILAPTHRAPKRMASQRLSALTSAVMFHLFFLVAFMFITVFAPVGRAPMITMVPGEPYEQDEVLESKVVQKTVISKPAAPSASSTRVVTVEAESAFVAPVFEETKKTFDINLLDSGVGMSSGFSLDGEGVESNVDFFGIQAGGSRICFIIDASPAMLLDEKGGMFAYNKVKNEIAAMLAQLGRGTAFNIIVYQGKRLSFFREAPVRALPSNRHRAEQWLDPLNRNYEALGLQEDFTNEGIVAGAQPIHFNDISGYTKAIQAALEQGVNTVFCISNGWSSMSRSLSPEDQAKLAEYNRIRREQVAASREDFKQEYDPAEVAAWKRAQEKARDWLKKENDARVSNGLAQKVVLNFGEIIQQVSPGARPPQGLKTPPPAPPAPPAPEVERMPAYGPEDVENHVSNLATIFYGTNKPDRPSVNMVLWLAEDEDLGDYEEHFKTLTRRNKGKLKVLKGLAALQNVTGYD